MTRLTLALGALAALVLTACEVHMGPVDVVRGSGNVKSESRDVHDFDRVGVSGTGTLTITQGSTESLTIHAEDNLLPLLHSDIEGGMLRLGPRNVSIGPTQPIRYDLTVKQLKGVELSGAAAAEAASLQSDQLALRISGAGKTHIGRVTASSMTVDISGSGEVDVDGGEVPRQTITISGAGDYRAPALASQQATVNVSGAGSCAVRVSEHLSAKISGAGQVSYAGSPTVDQEVSGAGKVTHTE
jgi:Putative auto-transporter adhesin, head GIN domain